MKQIQQEINSASYNNAKDNIGEAEKKEERITKAKKSQVNNNTGDDKKNDSNEDGNNSSNKQITIGGKINAGTAKIYSYAGGTGYSQYFKDDPIYTVLDEKNGYLKVRWHKNQTGTTGWFKKSDVKAYKTGAYNLLKDQLALTQEVAPEAIVRKDGSVLMPLTSGTSVLNGNATKNFYDFMNNPLSYMTDLLNKEAIASSPNNNITGATIKNDINLNITLPGVTNYEEFKNKMVKDADFGKKIQAMTIDLVTGKSSLAKYKK